MRTLSLIFACAFALAACTEEVCECYDSPLTGTWHLYAMLSDPGDGSGTFTFVDSERILEFMDDSTLYSNGDICYFSADASTNTYGTYSLADSTLTFENCSYSLSFSLANDSVLYVYYPCDEPCIARYRKY